MNLDSNDDDSEESDFVSIAGEDADVHLNHYRVSKLINYGPYGLSNGDNQANGAGSSRNRANLKQVKFSCEGKIMTLYELAAQKVACHFPFGLVEHYDQPVPEPMQCRIAYWSFPQDEEDVKLYTCLANGNADFFYRAEELLYQNAVRDMLQVGFHLSANVIFMNSETEHLETFNVALTFDRRRITSCSCTCSTSTFWCQHVVAVCLQRIRKPQDAKLRAPVSESLQRLEKNQLQKFAQYLINELPQQILPAAQKLLDELLSGDEAHINRNPAAPDPTAGALLNESTSWCLDYTHLSQDIRRILVKQCTAQPTVCSDPQSLHATAPPVTNEYNQLLRPIRGREPEGIWNLISIVGEMMKRRDPNLFPLLEIMTEEIMSSEKIITWWFETKVSLHCGSTLHFANTKNSQCTSQYSCSNFCDEIVHLWRLAALNPNSTPLERNKLYKKYYDWHLSILKRHKSLSENNEFARSSMNSIGTKTNRRNYLDLFPGFKSAMEGCQISWDDWDDKRGELVSIVDKETNGKDKPTKHNKKRKRRSKSKANAAANKTDSGDTNPNTLDQPSTSGVTSADLIQEGETEDHLGATIQVPETEELDDTQEDASENIAPPVMHSTNEPDHRQLDEEQNDEIYENVDPLHEIHENNVNQEEVHQYQNDQIEPELRVYFMEGQPNQQQDQQKPESFEDYVKLNARKLADPLETLYAKIEGLHAHGHLDEARRLARRLAHEILSQTNYPSLKQLFIMSRRRKKKGSLDNQMSIVASETLHRLLFLCNLLFEDSDNHGLIFKLVMFGIELKRSPAATKPLEVKLISQKQELILLLRKIALREQEMAMLREKAELIRDRANDEHSDALATLILGLYIFDVLVQSRNPNKISSDANLGFQTALITLGTKNNVSEVDHPLLCEGVRRQRGDLALTLIWNYREDQEKLDAILKQLLDKDFIEDGLQANCSQSVSPTTVINAIEQFTAPQAAVGKPSLSTPSSTSSGKKSQVTIQDQNQPSEAAVYFMFQLAITVFDKAGGSSQTAHLFRPQVMAQNGTRGIHRKLHMCTIRIALYALGLQNRSSPNWMQRTYNGRASFIQNQVLEVGLPAIKFLRENWVGYLTPVEAASVADKAGCSNDPETKRIAAEMAKSCLKYANFLNSTSVSRILVQCKEQTIEMIEEACTEIEQIAENDNVCPDVLFVTSRAWYNLYLKLGTDDRSHCANGNLYQLDNLVHPSPNSIQPAVGPVAQPDGPEPGPVVDWLAPNHPASYQVPALQQLIPIIPSSANGVIHIIPPPNPAHQAAPLVAMAQPMGALQQQQPLPAAVAQPTLAAAIDSIPIDPMKVSTNEQQQQPQQQQLHPLQWDVYARADFIITPETPTDTNIDYVRAAFRVGIKAMDSMRLPIHMGNKHNPKKLDEILWLLGISKSLGRECLYKFSRSTIKNITDPYILHIIILEIISFFAMIRLPEDHIDRTNVLQPMLDKCLDNSMRQVKDLVKHNSYDQKNCIESILDVVQTLTEVTQSQTTAQYYWNILKFVEHKIDSKRNNRRSRIHIDVSQRLNWLKRFEQIGPWHYCDDCWLSRGTRQTRCRTLY